MSTPTPLPEEPLAIIFSMIGSVLLPAVMEELLFRGGSAARAAPGRGKAGDMALRTVIYGGHTAAFPNGCPALAAGLALGIVTFYTGTLRWAILIHLCNNIIAWVTTYFPSPLTAILLPVGLLILGGIALLRLRRMPDGLRHAGTPGWGYRCRWCWRCYCCWGTHCSLLFRFVRRAG